jgi:hypothetical protein
MKALNPQFQQLLDQGDALKERLVTTLSKNNKDAFTRELRAWFNSAKNQTHGSAGYGMESLDQIFEFARLYLEHLTPEQCANEIDHAIGILASIPAKNPAPSVEIIVSTELEKLMDLGRAAMRPSRKPWKQFLERLSELKRKQPISADNDSPIVVSNIVDELLRNIDADPDNARDFVEEYGVLKSAVEARVTWFAKRISGLTFWIVSLLIVLGAVGVMMAHQFHGSGLIYRILFVGVMGFFVMELLGVLHHLAGLRSRLEALIRLRLRRLFVEFPDAHTASVLKLQPKR